MKTNNNSTVVNVKFEILAKQNGIHHSKCHRYFVVTEKSSHIHQKYII